MAIVNTVAQAVESNTKPNTEDQLPMEVTSRKAGLSQTQPQIRAGSHRNDSEDEKCGKHRSMKTV